ncbi:ninein-like protein isoform X2 [Schistocerca gregaria]|uniref:ninein-like protein isoform X2 n=1 Tax=Schistocerca gregaria TaxID=7010 RepID=UPI00211F2B1F|nr:ninein-like protein isoform X2 [Schistocerca gregaria]
MEGRSLDPYEQQLLAVFESCDEQNTGSLDRKSLEQLCSKLQLEEQGLELMDYLLGNDKSSRRVTFTEFKDGLLTMLREGQKKWDSGGRGSPDREVSPKFVFGQKKYGRRSKPEIKDKDPRNKDAAVDSDTEILISMDGDVKDIIMVMRSSPDTPAADESQFPRKRKTSIDDGKSFKRSISLPDNKTPGVSDDSAPPSLDSSEEEVLRTTCDSLGVGRNGYLNRQELALVCQRIGLDSVADEVVQQVFEKLSVDNEGRISLQEFLQLFRNAGSWATTVGVSVSPSLVEKDATCGHSGSRTSGAVVGDPDETGDVNKELHFLALDTNNSGLVPVEAVLELWETAGMSPATAARLARDLGLPEVGTGGQVRLSDLATTLESELPAAQADAAAHGYSALELLLHAALALYQAEVRCLRLSLEHLRGERDKLRADILDANERASLLAQEVDDSHARLEQSSQMQVKLLEQRHAEQLREVAEQLGQEREQLAAQVHNLEQRLAALHEEDSRLRQELAALKVENEAVDKENQSLLEQLEETRKAKASLQNELESLASLQQKISELEGSRDMVEPLLEQVGQLQTENTELRDRNDELKMKIEALTVQLSRLARSPPPPPPQHQAGTENNSETVTDEVGSAAVGGGVKRRGESALIIPQEENPEDDSPRLGKVRRCTPVVSNRTDVVDDVMNMQGLQIHPSAKSQCIVDADIDVDEPESLDSNPALYRDDETTGNNVRTFPRPTEIITKDSSEVERLQMRIAELEQRLSQQNSKLMEWEAERDCLQEKVNRCCDLSSKTLGSSDLVRGHLKKVFETLRKQAAEELMEDEEFLSSLQKQNCEPSVQRNCKEDKTDNIFKVTKSAVSNVQCDTVPSEDSAESTSGKKDVEQLERHCRDLESQLDQVKIEIVKILSEKKACSQENTTLKSHLSDLQGGSAEGQNNEAQELRERCAELEVSLELLRQEYERCEDYWAAKLDEERRLSEAEQRASDEKFSELLAKVREYEELCSSTSCDDGDGYAAGSSLGSRSGRLPTIDERASLEKQVTDLEEECEEMRQRYEQEVAEKDQQLTQLQERVRILEAKRSRGRRLDVAVQVADLENCSWESDRTFVVELDGGRRASQRLQIPTINGCATPETGSSSAESTTRHTQKLKGAVECDHQYSQQHRDTSSSEVHQTGGKRSNWRSQPDACMLQALSERLRQQEHYCHELQQKIRQYQQHADLMLQQTWQQHKEEIAELQSLLHSTQERLLQQTSVCKDQTGRLASADLLVKDLYVENAYLHQSVQRLEQRCHSLAQMTTDSSSV